MGYLVHPVCGVVLRVTNRRNGWTEYICTEPQKTPHSEHVARTIDEVGKVLMKW